MEIVLGPCCSSQPRARRPRAAATGRLCSVRHMIRTRRPPERLLSKGVWKPATCGNSRTSVRDEVSPGTGVVLPMGEGHGFASGECAAIRPVCFRRASRRARRRACRGREGDQRRSRPPPAGKVSAHRPQRRGNLGSVIIALKHRRVRSLLVEGGGSHESGGSWFSGGGDLGAGELWRAAPAAARYRDIRRADRRLTRDHRGRGVGRHRGQWQFSERRGRWRGRRSRRGRRRPASSNPVLAEQWQSCARWDALPRCKSLQRH